MKKAEHSFPWTPSLESCDPYGVTQSVRRACSPHRAFCLRYILGSKSPARASNPWAQLWHACPLSDQSTPFCWSCPPRSTPAAACPAPNRCVARAESSPSTEFGSDKCPPGANAGQRFSAIPCVPPACLVPDPALFCSLQVQRRWSTPMASSTASPPPHPSWGACGRCTWWRTCGACWR